MSGGEDWRRTNGRILRLRAGLDDGVSMTTKQVAVARVEVDWYFG
jgi:hypothetical protein